MEMNYPVCITCGHSQINHHNNLANDDQMFTGCMHDGCTCRKFEQPPADDKAIMQAERMLEVEKAIEQLRLDIIFYERMLDTGHWLIGDRHQFTNDELAWLHSKISAIEKQIETYHYPWYKVI